MVTVDLPAAKTDKAARRNRLICCVAGLKSKRYSSNHHFSVEWPLVQRLKPGNLTVRGDGSRQTLAVLTVKVGRDVDYGEVWLMNYPAASCGVSTTLMISPHVVTPECVYRGSTMLTATLSQVEWVGGPLRVSPGFPLKAYGNDGL